MVNASSKQSKEILSVIFGERYLGKNINRNNKFINEGIALLKAWGRDYVSKKI